MQSFSNAVKVGLVMALAIAAFAYWFFATSKGASSERDSYLLYAYIADASGLSLKSKISLGGLTVGNIEDIHLVDMDGPEVPPEDRPDHTGKIRHGYHSKVSIWVKKKYPLRSDVTMAKETEGLIGSKILRLYPGQHDYDRPELLPPILNHGDQIRHAEWEGDLDKVAGIAKNIGGQLQGLIELNRNEITDIVRSVRDFLGPDPGGAPPPSFPAVVGQLQDTMQDLDKSLTRLLGSADLVVKENRQTIQEVLDNINRISGELRNIAEGTGERGVALDSMVRNVTLVTEDLRHVVGDIKELVGGAQGAAGGDGGPAGVGMEGIKKTVERLNKNLENIESVTTRIERGEGNVGRFLKDDKLINDLEEAVAAGTDFLNGFSKTETHVDIMAWYNFRQQQAHSAISVKFQPRPDKYYLFELVNDPKRVGVITWRTTKNQTDGTTTVEQINEITDEFKATLMWAKMWGPLTLRVGLLESSGGVGANLNFWEDRIQVRADLFQFSAQRFPRLRTFARFSPLPHVYVLAGLDDPFNFNYVGLVPRNRLPYMMQRDWVGFDWRNPATFGSTDVFLGAGIFFTDEDLKAAFTQIPTSMIK